eukprot:SAG31_NODE_21336_length_552_cov_0.792494_1_plen_54_part_01
MCCIAWHAKLMAALHVSAEPLAVDAEQEPCLTSKVPTIDLITAADAADSGPPVV